MILVDSSVVIHFTRAPTVRLRQIIQNHQATICGVTVAETYAGTRTPAAQAAIAAALGLFGSLAIPDALWAKVGFNLAALGAKGITVPLPDAVIATLALEHNLEVWTYDAHFAMMQSVLPALRLFQEPP